MEIDGNTIVAAARGWIGTPYIHQASLKGVGCDCLGLLLGVWRETHDKAVPDVPVYSMDWGETTGEEVMINRFGAHMDEIARADAMVGDVLVLCMLRTGPAKHCGFLASSENGEATIIHSRANMLVFEELLTKDLERRIVKIYRVPRAA